MNFGDINKIIVFGKGQILASFILRFRNDFEIVAIIGPKHSTESVMFESKELTLLEFLEINNLKAIVTPKIIDNEEVKKEVTENTLGFSFGSIWIFKEDYIKLFDGRLLNTHGARLPQDRGGGGFSWRILRNERLGYSLIHQVDAGIDTGNIVAVDEYVYPHSCRITLDYEIFSAEKYVEVLDRFIFDIKQKKDFKLIPQAPGFRIYYPKLYSNIHGFINWDWKLEDIDSFICAFDDPHPGARTFVGGNKLVILKKCFTYYSDGTFHPFQKGIIYRASDEMIFVATEQGSLAIQEVFDIDGNDILKEMREGDRLFTPAANLEKAKQYRANYGPGGIKEH